MNIKTIDINGQTLRVVVRASRLANTTPLLMFNGIGASLQLILPFVQAMHPDLEVIAFDAPGVGGSSTPMLPYTFSCLSNTVSRMLNYLNVGQVDVIGLSWGGFLAQQFAHDCPERVRRLILSATSTGVSAVPPSNKVLNLMSSPRRYTDVEYAARITPEIYGGQFRHDKALAYAHAKKMVAAKAEATTGMGGNQGYYYQLMAVYWWSSKHWLSKIKQPTLLLGGNDDPIIPLINMQRMSDRIPNSELCIFEDGHLFLLTDLAGVLPLINNFLGLETMRLAA